MQKLVSESLDQFLNEYINPAEDYWANKEINKWEKRKEGIKVLDVEEVLEDPINTEVADSENELRKIINDINEYLTGREISSDEFNNFCKWLSLSAKSVPGEAIVKNIKNFIENNVYIMKDIATGGEKYSGSLKMLLDKLS